MQYGKTQLLTNQKPYLVTKSISNSEDGSYSSEIAENLDSTASGIGNIIGGLREENIVKRGKRTQAQYYEVDWPGFYRVWLEKLLEYERIVDGAPELAFAREDLEKDAYEDHAVFDFFQAYCRDYMKRNDESTIQDMIIDELYDGLRVREESGGLPDGLYPLYSFLDTVLAGITPSFESVEYAIIETFEKNS